MEETMLEKISDYIILFLVLLLAGFWYFGITSSAASLFDVEDENSPWYPSEENSDMTEPETTLPDYALDENGNVLINNDTTLDEVLNPEPVSSPDSVDTESLESVSGGDAYPGSMTSEEIETIVSDVLADSRAANLSIADAYLSSAIVDVFSRVVDGSPAHYKYAAYRLNPNDSNEGYLLIGPDAKVNGNYLEFSPGTQLCHYYRVQYSSGYQTYYNYKYDVSEIYDTYRVPYKNGQMIYTNMVSGFPTLSENNQNYIASVVIPVFIVAVCLFIIMRRKK